MELVFDDELFVHYRFVFLSPADDEDPDLEASRRGQVNGLLGAATGNALSLTTGTHTGDVPVRIEWHDGEPPVDDVWDDVVEASFQVPARDMRLATFDDVREVRLPVTGTHRVRLCATGFDAASSEDLSEGASVADRYLLQLWPATAAADRVVRVGSRAAQYWHDVARRLTAGTGSGRGAREVVVDPIDDDGRSPWSPNLQVGVPDGQRLAGIPLSVRSEMTAPLAQMACDAMDIGEIEPIRGALLALQQHQELPNEMTNVADVMSRLERKLGLGRLPADARWSAPSRGRIEAAVKAVFVAADPDVVANLDRLLSLVTVATGAHGELVLRQLWSDLGHR